MPIFGEAGHGIYVAGHGLAGAVLFFSLVVGAVLLYAPSQINWRHVRTASIVASTAYLVTFFFGWLVYPVFRVDVRAAYFDSALPHATGLFEIKEHVAALGAFVAIGVLLFALFGKLTNASGTRRQTFGGLYASLTVLSFGVMLLGFIVGHFQP